MANYFKPIIIIFLTEKYFGEELGLSKKTQYLFNDHRYMKTNKLLNQYGPTNI